MENLATQNLTPQQQAERQCLKMQVSIDQYKNDLRQFTTNTQVTEAGLQAIVKKYTAFAEESQCTTIKLLCSNIITDAQNLLTINQTKIEL